MLFVWEDYNQMSASALKSKTVARISRQMDAEIKDRAIIEKQLERNRSANNGAGVDMWAGILSRNIGRHDSLKKLAGTLM